MRGRKLLLPRLLVAAFAMTMSPLGLAQSGQAGALYRPVELKLQATARRLFSSYRREYPGQTFYTENFYPIGWSKSGNFAYYVEPVDEACGCYFAKLFILDLKSDKVLWTFEHEGDSIDEDQKAGKPYSFSTLWRAKRKLFTDKLREHGIEPQGRFSLLSFPASYKGDSLMADFKAKRKDGLGEDAKIYGVVGTLNLQLASKRNGKKTVLDYSYPGEDGLPLYVGMVGYVQSPFEPRIAVILMEIYRGYEGPPNTGTVKIVGANLATGFK
ncbi:MAG TPA: hypothetical protein VF766_00925 [Pyrinomonadaceae bacterium]